MDKKRTGGILMPISSLPSSEGIGTLGEEAYRFVDYLNASSMKIWQVLPLNPTNYGDSPYQSCCSDALNYYFIDLKTLVDDGLLTSEEVLSADLGGNIRRVDYGKQFYNKIALLRKAFLRFDVSRDDFKQFLKVGKYSDFSVFMSLKCKFSHRAWTEWDEPFRIYDENVVAKYVEENYDEYLFWQFTQFIFLRQWEALKDYAHSKDILIMGDIPLYLAYDSLEMWKYGSDIFKVDEDRNPSVVAGVPPDAFSDDGQLWGNPVYNWHKMKENGYKWWNVRIDGCLELVDILRIDHFRGFDRYFEIPAQDKTARNGQWVDGPKEDLFLDKLDYNIIAEDLGVLDDGVVRLMNIVGYPGMKVLEFAFDGSADNSHKPSNYGKNCVCYTGTHDNMPLTQYIIDLSDWQRGVFYDDLRRQCGLLGFEADTSSPQAACASAIRLAFMSCADTAIIPMWDLLTMGGEARINFPSTVSNMNWSWRFVESDFDEKSSLLLKELAIKSQRA